MLQLECSGQVRDIYKLEFDIFKSPAMVAYYLAMVRAHSEE